MMETTGLFSTLSAATVEMVLELSIEANVEKPVRRDYCTRSMVRQDSLPFSMPSPNLLP
jgi:hypothetical protein